MFNLGTGHTVTHLAGIHAAKVWSIFTRGLGTCSFNFACKAESDATIGITMVDGRLSIGSGKLETGGGSLDPLRLQATKESSA